MRKVSFIIGILLCCSVVPLSVSAKPVSAKLVLPKEVTWEGLLVGRDGVFLKFQKDGSSRAMSLGADSVEEIIFDPPIDEYIVEDLTEKRNFGGAIDAMQSVLKDYEPYMDIKSDLTGYYHALMRLYFWNQDYEETLKMALRVMDDDRDEDKVNDARVFRILSLIETGDIEKAEAAVADVGWDTPATPEDSAQKLFVNSKLYQLKKEYGLAIEYAARIVAFYSTDPDWVASAEILCADLYSQLALLDVEDKKGTLFESAYTVLEHIMILNADSKESDNAKNMKLKVDDRKADWEDRLEEIEMAEAE